MVAIRDDLTTRSAYVSDASIYRRVPQAVVEPGSVLEIREALEIARKNGWSVTSRGGGTSVAGNAIGEGLIIDLSRNFKRILSIDPEAMTATVEPGVICDELRDAAAPFGLTYGPDPSTHSRCTLGGMVANNSCGSHSVAWGTSADNLVSLKMMLADGREVEFGAGGTDDTGLNDKLRGLRDENIASFRTELGTFPRQVSGYGLHHLLDENRFNVAKAVAGSEGTLGIITELTVKLVARPKSSALVVLGFADPIVAAEAAPLLRIEGVSTVEGMGADLLSALRSRRGKESAGSNLPKGGAWLYCEVNAETNDGLQEVADRLMSAASSFDFDSLFERDSKEIRKLWEIRELGAGIVTRLPDGREAWPGWEDSAVPAERLAPYLADIYQLFDEFNLEGIPYGHFGEGCVHMRISFNFETEEGLTIYRLFMNRASQLVKKYGGSISGEHGDGRARSEMLGIMYSEKMIQAFEQFKAIFDAEGFFNPGVLVSPEPITQGIRPSEGARRLEITPVHAFSKDNGSFASAVNRCVGVGSCRSDTGAMCPSFQASHDEISSTRGRSRVLAEMLRGETFDGGFQSTEAKDALDLCLSCKACKSECPVNVDMATYKSEFLNHFHGNGFRSFFGKRRRPMAHFTMGWFPIILRNLSRIPGLVALTNKALSISFFASIAKKLGGIEPRRDLPAFAPRTLVAWNRKRKKVNSEPSESVDKDTVVIWPDTFTNFASTGSGEAAIQVLEAMGYRVLIPMGNVCCGLTWHSTGQLDMAIKSLRETLNNISGLLEEGYPIISLEPSCTAMLKDESIELLPNDEFAHKLSNQTISFGTFVANHMNDNRIWPFEALSDDKSTTAICQIHCHQKATIGYSDEVTVMKKLGIEPDLVGGGCCGLAGNWGFEPGHYEMSQTLAERELFPKIRSATKDTFVVADGFSCRTQIKEGTSAEPLHLAQILRQLMH